MNASKIYETTRHIRSLLGKNQIEEALAALYEYFSALGDKSRLHDIVALQARFYGLTQAITRGTISETETGIQRGQICNSILLILDSIAPDERPPAPSKPVKKGKLLHNIPGSMKIGEVIECRVRIATTEKQLRKNFPDAEHVETIPLERIGERMEVRLVAADTEAFIIKRQNKHARQFIEPDVHTEWVFDIIPMKTGRQKLFLKVDIILEQKGGKTYRDEVISVPVEVSTTEPTAPSEWQQAADIAPKPARQNLLNKMFGGLLVRGRNENARRMMTVLAVGIAGIVIAQMFWNPFSEMIQRLFNGNGPEPASLRTVGIVVHSPADSVAEELIVANMNVRMTKIIPGIWEVMMQIPDDSTRYNIFYRGNAARGYWDGVLLNRQITNLYVSAPVDTAVCGIYVAIDTFVHPAENWRLVWEKNALEKETFQVLPISDTTFFVAAGNACQTLYNPAKKYNFRFVNDSCVLYAGNVSLARRPATLRFKYHSPEPMLTSIRNAPVTPTVIADDPRPVAHEYPTLPGKPKKPAKPPKAKKVKIFLTIPPKWAKLVQDLEMTVDGRHFSSELPWQDGQIPFELEPGRDIREICIRILGQKSGEPLSLGCYEGPLVPGMKLEMLDGRIIRR